MTKDDLQILKAELETRLAFSESESWGDETDYSAGQKDAYERCLEMLAEYLPAPKPTPPLEQVKVTLTRNGDLLRTMLLHTQSNPHISVEVRPDFYCVKGLSPDGTILYLVPGDVQLRLRPIA